MCLILFQKQEHPNYKLILAANRDEAYNRPTKEAGFWDDHPSILAGRDLLQMGTWLGITKSGRIAALTNYRHPDHMKSGAKSRGEITTDFLTSDKSAQSFLETLRTRRSDYVGFNLLVGEVDNLYYYSNIEDSIQEISAGTHGLSNHFLDTPWPKVEKGKKKLKAYTSQTDIVHSSDLFEILTDSEEAAEDNLPSTGIEKELERKLSSMFIQMPDYGTRCSTVLTIDNKNQVSFTERTYQNGIFQNEVSYQFKIEQAWLKK